MGSSSKNATTSPITPSKRSRPDVAASRTFGTMSFQRASSASSTASRSSSLEGKWYSSDGARMPTSVATDCTDVAL